TEVTYAYVAQGGARLFGPSGTNWTNAMQRRATLASSASVTYTRRIGVAGPSDVTGALLATGYVHPAQWVRVRVVDGAAGAPVVGARVVLRDAQGAPVAMGGTGAHGEARVAVEPGSFVVDVETPGRAVAPAARAALAVAVAPGATRVVDVPLT